MLELGMRINNKIIILFSLIIFISVSVLEAVAMENNEDSTKKVKILSLEDCIREGLSNYQEIKAAEWDRVWAKSKLSEAKAARYAPKFTMTSLIGPVPGVDTGFGPPDFPSHSIDWDNWTFFFQIKFELFQPLYTFGKIQSAVNMATHGVKAKELEVAVKKRNLVNKIRKTYYALAFGYSGLRLLDEMKDKMESAKKKVQKLLDKGSTEVTDIDLFKLKVFETDMKRRYVDAYSSIDIGKRALMVLMGNEPDNGIDIKDKTCKPMPVIIGEAKEYYKLARHHREELRQMKEVIKIKKAQIAISKSDFFPTLFLGGMFTYTISPGREDISNPYLKDDFNDKIAGFALGLNQNLSFGLTTTRFNQSKAEYKKLLNQSELVTNGVLLEVRKSFEEAMAKQKLLKITKKGYKQGRSWMTSAFLGFDMGTMDTAKLIEAFAAYTKTKMDYYRSIFDYNVAISDLSMASGVDMVGLVY